MYNTEKIINLNNIDVETVKYLISVYYMQGISEIEIRSETIISAEHKNEIKNLQLYLPGLTVESESFNYIKFKIHNDHQIDIINGMKTFSQKILVLLEDLEKVVKNPNKEMAIDLKNRSDELYKLYNLLIRQIALISQKEEEFEIKGITTRDLILYAITMRDMGRMLSHIKMASTIVAECTNIPNVISEIAVNLIIMFKEASEVFQSKYGIYKRYKREDERN